MITYVYNYDGDQDSLVPFHFQDIDGLQACWVNGIPYFTDYAIGKWLEYKYPQSAIDKIIDHNPHILKFTTQVRLAFFDGGRVVISDYCAYDPIGFQLIVNKSSQQMAVAFQVPVALMVVAYMNGELKPVL